MTVAPWDAPSTDTPVRARVTLPGSKSLTNRLLLLAALGDRPSRITAPLLARDTRLMAAALTNLGAQVDEADGDWIVTPGPVRTAAVDTGLAGTVMRFVPPLAALADGPVSFDGDAYARERPMSTLIDGLRQAGVVVRDEGTGRLPFTVEGRGRVAGGRVRIDASGSSQFVSGLLLAAARYDKGIEVVHDGPRTVPSLPHIEMTLEVLRQVGVEAGPAGPGSWRVEPGPIRGRDWVVEPDLSNAAPFLAAALATGGRVSVPHWPATTTQPGAALTDLLARMGAGVERRDGELTVTGTGTIAPLAADLRDVTELVTVLAALAALADGPSHLTGLAHMRGHETDRLAALTAELSALGASVVEEPDGLQITPGPLRPTLWHAYADHRMATAGAVLGLVVPGLRIDDIGATTKTLPDFPGLWAGLLHGA